jgi:hypothetical protein
MAQTQSGYPSRGENFAPYDRGRDRVARAFLGRKSFRSYGAAFTDGRRAFSYGYHYVAAEHRPDGSIGVNEARVSVTTSGHVGAIRRAMENAGWRPTAETYRDDASNRHLMRVWRMPA